MTIQRVLYIVCEQCRARQVVECLQGEGKIGVADARARLEAKKAGWGHVEGEGDMCPDCVAKFIYEESGCEHRTRENVGRGG